MKKLCTLIILAALAAPTVAQEVVSTIAFTSTRDYPAADPVINGGEIYFIDYLTDGTFSEARRVTWNTDADLFPALSPDGRGKIVFDSNRLRLSFEAVNTSDLFLMNHDGTEQTFLTRGGSPSWSPAGPLGKPSKMIAFHASASGTGLPVTVNPGSATEDSDIFVVNVDDLLEHGAQPQNITSNRTETIDDDPSWSPYGQRILFTSYVRASTNVTHAEIWVMNADGTGQTQLTTDDAEKRGPAWSPDGSRILYMCRTGDTDFEICVMNADGTGQMQLTDNDRGDLGPTWSPDGQRVVFHRAMGGSTSPACGGLPMRNQLWIMDLSKLDEGVVTEKQLTCPPGLNLLATSWGEINAGQGGGAR